MPETKTRVLGGWAYVGPPSEMNLWQERLNLLAGAVSDLREAGYRELARKVEEERVAERNRLTERC